MSDNFQRTTRGYFPEYKFFYCISAFDISLKPHTQHLFRNGPTSTISLKIQEMIQSEESSKSDSSRPDNYFIFIFTIDSKIRRRTSNWCQGQRMTSLAPIGFANAHVGRRRLAR
jgi:hypothetical protein